MNTLKAGATVPPFTLLDENSNEVSREDFKGQTMLLYFFPKAMSPDCTIQAQGLRDIKPALEEKGVVVCGVSIDPVERLAKFIERDELNFSLLSDEDHAVADLFGVWGPKKFGGKEYDGLHRISFLIDENGVVEKVFDKFNVKNHHEVVLEYLNS